MIFREQNCIFLSRYKVYISVAGQEVEDDIPFFYDLYLDLIVYPDGTILTDDMDELEEALKSGDISKELFKLAIDTKEELENTLLSDIGSFERYTKELFDETTI